MGRRHWLSALAALGLIGGSHTAHGQAPGEPGAPYPLTAPSLLPSVPPPPIPTPFKPAVTVGPPIVIPSPAAPIISVPVIRPPATAAVPVQGQTITTVPPTIVTPGQIIVTQVTPAPVTMLPPADTPLTSTPEPASPPMPGTTVSPAPATTPAVLPPAKAPAADTYDSSVKFKFKPGDNNLLQMESTNGLFKFYVGGRLQIDAVWLRTSDAVQAPASRGGIGDVDDAVNFRRARFDLGGTFYRNIDFLLEFDFINTFNAERRGDPLPANTPVPTDLWVTFREVPYVGNLRIGNQKPPISLEHMVSSRFLPFMERSLSFDAFIENQNNGFEPGVSVFDTYLEEHGTWHVGVFKNTRNVFGWNVGDGEYDVTGRVTFLPIYENDGEYLVHVGVGASHRDFDDEQDRMRARLLLRNGPAVLHNIVAEVRTLGDYRDMVVPEFAMVWGSLTVQAEFFGVWINNARVPVDTAPRRSAGTACFQGAYAQVLYFLTGEHDRYNRKTGAFGRVIPHSNFTGFGCGECEEGDCGPGECGIGAWQVGVRYSWLDLDNKIIRGGTIHDVTVGLNWFLNPYMKWQWNYICEYRNAFNPRHDGWVHGFGTRIAFDF
jgi:phosphate-selective porin OprO and OprP